MLITLVVILAMAAINYLNAEATESMKTQANCVAMIPGSPEAASCGYHPTTTLLIP